MPSGLLTAVTKRRRPYTSFACTTGRHFRVVLLIVAALLPAPALRADTIILKSGIGTLPVEGTIISIDGNELVYVSASTDRQTHKPIDNVLQINAPDEPKLTAAEQAYADGKWSDAASYYQAVLNASGTDWVKNRAVVRLIDASARNNQFAPQITASIELSKRDAKSARRHQPLIKGINTDQLNTAAAEVDRASGNPALKKESAAVLKEFLADLYLAKGDAAAAAKVLATIPAVKRPNSADPPPTTQPRKASVPPAAPPAKMSPAERAAALADAKDRLAKLEESEPEVLKAAVERAKSVNAYQDAQKQLADALAAQSQPSATREQRSLAARAAAYANAHLSAVLRSITNADPQVVALRKRMSEAADRVRNLTTDDLLDRLGDNPGQCASIGAWEFKGNSLLCSESDGPVKRAGLNFPGSVPQEYELVIRMRRMITEKVSGVDVMVPVEGGTLVCEIDSPRNYTPADADRMAIVTTSDKPRLSEPRRLHEIVVRVGANGRRAVAFIDGTPLLAWKNPQALPVQYPSELKDLMPPRGALGICLTGSVGEIESATVRPLMNGEYADDASIAIFRDSPPAKSAPQPAEAPEYHPIIPTGPIRVR